MSDEARDEYPATILQFPTSPQSIESTDEFELDVPPSQFGQTLGFRFFPRVRAKEAVPAREEICLVLPTGSVLLVEIRPPASPSLIRSLPV